MDILIPDFALVLLLAPQGCETSEFAARHFAAGQIPVSPDPAAAALRLEARQLTVIAAGVLRPSERGALLALARKYHAPAVALVFDLPRDACTSASTGQEYSGRPVSEFRQALPALKDEGYRAVYTMNSLDDLAAARVIFVPLPPDRRGETGPFDLIGDVHGCATELETLLERLGYAAVPAEPLFPGGYAYRFRPPPGRKAVFIGDLVDRGPRILDAFQLARAMVAAGDALCVPGNHDDKLLRKLRGGKVTVSFGLEKTLEELDALAPADRERVSAAMMAFFSGLPSHLVLDGGRLVAAHAGIRESMIGRDSRRVRDFTLYGETTGETDEAGLPVRKNWALRYRGSALVVYGHVAVGRPEWVNRTVDIDTGCVYGGSLTALRYPELEVVQVAALRVYRATLRPLGLPEE